MEDYVSLPSKRFIELVKKYVNYRKLKSIKGKHFWKGFARGKKTGGSTHEGDMERGKQGKWKAK